MNKYFFLIMLALLLKMPAWSQTSFWTEPFHDGDGWEFEDNWSVIEGKLEFYWSPSIPNFDQSAISPIISLPANTSDLIVNQYLDIFQGTGNEFAEIRIIPEGSAPVSIWNYNLTGGTWGQPEGTDITFPMQNFAGQNIQIEFRTYGLDTYNWNWWDVMEIQLVANFDNDLAATGVDGPISVDLNEPGTWTVNVKNLGSQPRNNFTVRLYSYKTSEMLGEYYEEQVLDPHQSRDYNFQWTSNVAFNTVLFGIVQNDGDSFDQNNVTKSRFMRINPEIDFDILVWDNDNGIQTVICPEQGDLIEPSDALTRALDAAGYTYDYVNVLPAFVTGYEIIFSTMGCYCVD